MGVPEDSVQNAGRLHIGKASGSIASGKYRLFASLGRGGMADVLLGVASGPAGFNKLVVVKRLRPLLADDPALTNMFLDEARLAARMNHPNVIHTYEIGEGNGAYFIAMEYLDGQPLHEILHALKSSDLPVRPAIWAKIISDALAGLHYAHELTDYDGTPMNVVHRDVSPQNIIVTYDGGVKLVDFGIAKATVNTTRTESGIIKGKLAYMAPEQAEPSDGHLDRRADIFATGIVLWECLTLKRLITGDAQSAMTKIVDMEFKPPSTMNPDVSPALDALVLKALERDPEKRFQTAQEMREALEAFIRSEGFVRDEELGNLLGQLFKSQRADLRRQIKLHMANVGSSGKDFTLGGPDSSRIPPSSAPTERTLTQLTESEKSVRAVQSSARRPPEKKDKAPRFGMAVAVGLAAVALVALLFVGQRGEHREAAGAGSLATATAAPLDVRPSVHVAARATPDDAILYLDDAELPGNPYAGAFPKDTLDHRVRASRAGYVSDTKLIRLDGSDVSVAFDLQRATPDAAPPAPKPGPKGAPAPAPPKPAGSARPPGRPALDDDPGK
jgi:serine/threonine protein kinase